MAEAKKADMYAWEGMDKSLESVSKVKSADKVRP